MSINPFDPHPPFDPPKEYLDRYDPETLPYPLFRETDIVHQRKLIRIDQQTTEAVNPYKSSRAGDGAADAAAGATGPGDTRADHAGKSNQIDTASQPPADYDARLVKACYYAMIELIDHQLGRIIDVLEAAGLAVPEYMQGESLLPILQGESNGAEGKDHVFCEFFDALDQPDATHGTMFFDGRYKLIVYHGQIADPVVFLYIRPLIRVESSHVQIPDLDRQVY